MRLLDRFLFRLGYVRAETADYLAEINLVAGMLFVVHGRQPSEAEFATAWRQWQADQRRARMVRENT